MPTIQLNVMDLQKAVRLPNRLKSLLQIQVLLRYFLCMSKFPLIELMTSNLILSGYMLYIEIDDDDGNDILNYSGTTESYSVPSDHDSDETVDYCDADDQEGN